MMIKIQSIFNFTIILQEAFALIVFCQKKLQIKIVCIEKLRKKPLYKKTLIKSMLPGGDRQRLTGFRRWMERMRSLGL